VVGQAIRGIAKLADGERRQAKLIVRRGAGGFFGVTQSLQVRFFAHTESSADTPWQTIPS